MLAPFMPFITEELNEKIFGNGEHLAASRWPELNPQGSSDTGLNIVVELISEIRAIRSEMNVPLSAKPQLEVTGATQAQRQVLSSMTPALLRMARLEDVVFHDNEFAKGTARTSVQGMDVGLPLAGILDFDAERARLNKEIKAGEAEMAKINGKLSNSSFLAKAPEAVVEENRRRFAEEEGRVTALKAALNRLDS